jgi:hypothetical protein
MQSALSRTEYRWKQNEMKDEISETKESAFQEHQCRGS